MVKDLAQLSKASGVVTGNSIRGAAGSERTGHCRQHTISAREDPRSLPMDVIRARLT
jgi:hypothetical protein